MSRPRSDGRLLIGARWRDAVDGGAEEFVSPVDSSVIGTVAQATEADLDDAVAAARQAAGNDTWSTLSGYERSRVLSEFADLVEGDGDRLARLQALEMGKPVALSLERDVPRAATALRYCAGLAARRAEGTLPAGLSSSQYDLSTPYGVVAAITSVQHPVTMVADVLAPALAHGNTVVLKPSRFAALSAVRLAELGCEAGLPAGVLNLVTGSNPKLGLALAGHAGVDKVAYTGSRRAGRLIGAACAETLTPLQPDYNGVTVHIVFVDTCLDRAARLVARSLLPGRYESRGMGVRILVHRPGYREFVELLGQQLGALTAADPLREDTVLGPLPHAEQARRFIAFVDRLRAEGAGVLYGGTSDGLYAAPTLIAGVDITAERARSHESAAPYALIEPIDSPQEALERAHRSGGLVRCTVHTASRERAAQLVTRARTEVCMVSTCDPEAADADELEEDQDGAYQISSDDFETYTRRKVVLVDIT